MSREPAPFSILVNRPPDVVRVIVFGESAAFGDPLPDYGLARMLEAMLELRHAGVQFEVVNAAITAINSHAIHHIASDCAEASADAWVVYMGNNEVVGPFGAGTVFGSQTPPLLLVRASIATQSWRTGQFVRGLISTGIGGKEDRPEWGGMAMFLDHRVERDDPRMASVYHHFEENLADIISLARGAGAGVVVSTVAVNLLDFAPFAALNVSDASYGGARELYQAGRYAEAVKGFETNGHAVDANLHYQWGRSLLAMGDTDGAMAHLSEARDLDALRFRCDAKQNEIIRRVVSDHESESVRLVDAAAEFNRRSERGVAGNEFFYEHVHLTFDGNYQLARLMAEQLETLPTVARRLDASTARPWPTTAACADRLGWARWAEQRAVMDMVSRLNDAPFTQRLDNKENIGRLLLRLRELAPGSSPEGLQQAVTQTARAVADLGDDHVLRSNLALLLAEIGDLASAREHALRAAELLPHDAGKWAQLAIILDQLGEREAAVSMYRKALRLKPDRVWVRHSLAMELWKLQRVDESIDEIHRAVTLRPSFGPGYLLWSRIMQSRDEPEKAESLLRKAIEHKMRHKGFLVELATVLSSKRWDEDAAAIWLDALHMDPTDVSVRLNVAKRLALAGHREEAIDHYEEAVRLRPKSAEVRYRFGQFHALGDDHVRAGKCFAEAVSLAPGRTEIRVDLGMALLASGHREDALRQFERVLTDDPQNETARTYVASLREELGAGEAR